MTEAVWILAGVYLAIPLCYFVVGCFGGWPRQVVSWLALVIAYALFWPVIVILDYVFDDAGKPPTFKP